MLHRKFQLLLLSASIVTGPWLAPSVRAQASRRGPRIVLAPSFTDMLDLEDVRSEIQLSNDQFEKVVLIREGYRKRLQEMSQQIRTELTGMTAEEQKQQIPEMSKRIQQLRAETEEEIAKVLQPQQVERAKQLVLRFRLQRGGLLNALADADAAKTLQILPPQREKMIAIQKEIRSELEEQVRKLQEKAQSQMLEVLTPMQRAQWQAMLGEPFEFRERIPTPQATGP